MLHETAVNITISSDNLGHFVSQYTAGHWDALVGHLEAVLYYGILVLCLDICAPSTWGLGCLVVVDGGHSFPVLQGHL